MSCCNNNNKHRRCCPCNTDVFRCVRIPRSEGRNDCFNGKSFADIKYNLNNDNCKSNEYNARRIETRRNIDFCSKVKNCCEKPTFCCKPITLGCEQVVNYRLCTDPNGCAYLYPCECRDPFWPEFAHPRSLCCSQLYRKGAEIVDDDINDDCCEE